jgi:tetratricopeptide (TPR) repeat protein
VEKPLDQNSQAELSPVEAVAALYSAALALFEAGDRAGAQAACLNILRSYPDAFSPARLLGVLALQAGQREDALGWLRKARAAASNLQLKALVGMDLFRAAAFDEAVEVLAEARALSPAEPRLLGAWLAATSGKSLSRYHEAKLGRAPDIFRPRTFNDHMLRWIIYGRDPKLKIICDKFALRGFLESRVGPDLVVPLLRHWDRAEDVDWASLPDSFVIKASHGSGQCLVIEDKAAHDPSVVLAQVKTWLSRDFFELSKEWAYLHLHRRVLVEPLLRPRAGDALVEVQVYTFGGKPKMIMTVTGQKGDQGRKGAWYRLDGRRLDLATGKLKPADLSLGDADRTQLVEIAERACQGFKALRVDFYLTDQGPKIGELTPYTGGGRNTFLPAERDEQLGRLWTEDYDLADIPDHAGPDRKL